jgi:hypothetical protein
VRFGVLTAVVMKSSIFWDIMPCSSVKVKLSACSRWILLGLTIGSEATCSSETSAYFHRCKWRCIPEDRSLHVTFDIVEIMYKYVDWMHRDHVKIQ